MAGKSKGPEKVRERENQLCNLHCIMGSKIRLFATKDIKFEYLPIRLKIKDKLNLVAKGREISK